MADFPSQVAAPVQYGRSIMGLVAYFSVYQYVPFRRLKQLFGEVFQLPIGEGTLVNLLEKAAVKSESFYDRIKEEIKQSKVVGSDETGAKVNGEKWWIWVWQNIQNTFLAVAPSRGSKVIAREFSEGLPKTKLVSDRWAAQLKMVSGGNQLCLAHLLRDVRYLAEAEKEEFAERFKKLLVKVFDIRPTVHRGIKHLRLFGRLKHRIFLGRIEPPRYLCGFFLRRFVGWL